MIDTLEKLNKLVDDIPEESFASPVISYYEWLCCFNDFINKIKTADINDSSSFDSGTWLRFVTVDLKNMNEKEINEYNKYFDLVAKFFNAYSNAPDYNNYYQANPKEVLKQVLSGKATYDTTNAYRPLK